MFSTHDFGFVTVIPMLQLKQPRPGSRAMIATFSPFFAHITLYTRSLEWRGLPCSWHAYDPLWASTSRAVKDAEGRCKALPFHC